MKNIFCYSYATCAKKRLKKLSETIKEELLDSLIDIEKKDETGLEDAKYPKEAVEIIKEHQELFKCQNSKIINIVDKQGELLKRFKGPD